MASQIDHYKVRPKPDEIQPFTMESTKPKKRTFYDGVWQLFKDYCSTTSIHGFAYFGDSRTHVENIWWILVFIVSMIGCSYMIYEIFEKWKQSPVLVSFETKNEPIYKVPFPAVTICPTNKINKEAFNITELMYEDFNGTSDTYTERKKHADYMGALCDKIFTDSFVDYFNATDFFEFVRKDRVDLPLLSDIKFRNEIHSFGDLFKETYTQQGLCYTYNRMRMDEIYSDIVLPEESVFGEDFNTSSWDPENQYQKDAGVKTYPKRAITAGIKNGIIVTLIEPKSNIDYICEGYLSGYTVTLHYPCRMPMTREEYFYLPSNQALLVPIEASMTLTSDRIKNYEPEKRDCYFSSERQLKYFRYYTRNNCKLECLTNATLKACGCAEFYMPRVDGVPLCGPGKKMCVDGAEDLLKDEEVKRKFMKENPEVSFTDVEDDECDCLALCSDVTYSANTEPIKLKKAQVQQFVDLNLNDSVASDLQMSILILYFKGEKLHTTERNELYGPSDFISNFGGIIGLFTGFSILSCMEILYFLTLRIWGNIKLYGYWAGPKN